MSWIKAPSRSAIVVTWLVFLPAVCAQAQKLVVEKKIGDWILYEFDDFDQDPPPPPKGVVDTARTPALNGRDATLAFKCSAYEVDYFLYEDHEFSDAVKKASKIEINQPIYTGTNKDHGLYEKFSWGGDNTRGFHQRTAELIGAGNFMVCPANDEKHPACLTFSLRGITAALKAICPKR